MKALVCEMCNSNDIVKQDGYYVCQHCGTKYSPEEAKKLMIEGKVDVSGSTVKIDKTEELAGLYEVARRAKDMNNSENAQELYEKILIKDPKSWEAAFYSVYFQSMNCKIGGIRNAAIGLRDCEASVLKLIKDTLTEEKEQRGAVLEVMNKLTDMASLLFDNEKNHYDNIGTSIKTNYHNDFRSTCVSICEIMLQMGDNLIKLFGDKYTDFAAKSWKNGIKALLINADKYGARDNEKTLIEQYSEKIREYDPDYQTPALKKPAKGCYIATAVYGSYNCPQVWTLRRYRDGTLAKTWYGRAFIHTYYAISPTFVKWFGSSTWFKNMWKPKLDRMVKNLREKGVEDTPYNDTRW